MKKRQTALSAAVAALLVAFAAGAGSDCRCRAPGIIAEAGQTVCLPLPGGGRLARCDKVLNNSAWTLLGSRCDVTT